MSGGIFLIQSDNTLVEMKEQQYDSEDLLQKLLETYPNLLAGDQMDSTDPRKWLLISREMGLPSEEEGSDRWALDHLFLDQDAIPTLIEVKRSSDTRIRREVVGQMLDYAANLVQYLPPETIRARFEENCRHNGTDPVDAVEKLIGPETTVEAFWQAMKTNHEAGRIRLVFVADVIPPELQSIVEFLNKQMDPAEVLAVEIRQYVGQGLTTLVPRVIGQTAEAQQKKGGARPPTKQWNEASFFEELQEKRGEKAVEAAREILNWSTRNSTRIYWGRGNRDGSFVPVLGFNGADHYSVTVYTYGKVEIQFQLMLTRKPFDVESKRIEMLTRLNQVPGISFPANAIKRRPSIPLVELAENNAVTPFLAVLDWYVSEVKKQPLA